MENEEKTTTEKIGFFKKSWKNIVTGVVCAVVGAGVMLGADVTKVQETITKAQARNVAIAAAVYSAEQVLERITTIATAEKKALAIKEAVNATTIAIPNMITAATTVKEVVSEVKEKIVENKETIKKETNTKQNLNVSTKQVKAN